MPATPIYSLPYPAATDPADVPTDMQELAERVALVLGGALSATPPATPFDGQLWATSPAAGVVWVFRYNAASASPYKWEFIGGPALYAEVPTNEQCVTVPYAALATPGPALTLPRPGDYDVDLGFNFNNCGVGQRAYMSYDIGATGAADADGVMGFNATANALIEASVMRARRKTGLGAVTLTAKYRVTGASSWFQNRWLRATPVRLS